ncbi:MAG TPA: mucoidy inhibitor MuiA family protein [Planctomycetota bacterium]|nr:mucoidy inhibitor MuiA family protein [Planctomycetota bacterium]
MRTRLFPACLFAILLSAAAAPPAPAGEPIEAKSAIGAVTVYLDRALVTRTAAVRCAAGRSEFVLAGLPAELADASIRVGAKGATVRGVRVERVFLERTEAAEVRRLEDELTALHDTEAAIRDDLGVLEGEARFMKGLSASAPEKATRMLSEGDLKLPDVAGVERTLELVTKTLSANAAKVREANRKLRELQPRIEAKSRELGEKRASGRLEQKKVTVALEAAAAADARLELSYLLPGAMWFPAYDVRADVDKGELELVYYAVIQQATGEDWPGAELTLNASRPAERTVKPEPAPWLLGGAPLPGNLAGAQELLVQQAGIQGNSLSSFPQIKQQYGQRAGWNRKAHANMLDNEEQVVRLFRSVAARGTSVAFPVPARETVLTDGKPHRVTIAVEKLGLASDHSAVPALSLATYVTGRAANTSKLPLLPGDASVYLAGDLIGTSSVGFVAPGEEAAFYLGVDETVKVTRKLDSKLSSIKSWGKRQRVEAAYSIVVENFKKRAVTVRIEEALPVSQDSAITVKIRKTEPDPAETERGVSRWTLAVPAGGKGTVNLAYSIEYPLEMAAQVEASPAEAANPVMMLKEALKK